MLSILSLCEFYKNSQGFKIFHIKSLILMIFNEILQGRRPNIRVCSQEAKQLFRPWLLGIYSIGGHFKVYRRNGCSVNAAILLISLK